MRYSLAVLLLFAVLSVMNVLAAPVPAPYAILDIGPPPKGMTAEEYCKDRIDRLTAPDGFLWYAGAYAEVIELPSVAPTKNARSWLAKNIRVKEEDGGRRLRLTFRAGTRTEQVIVLNTLLRVYFREGEASLRSIKVLEKALRPIVEGRPRMEQLIKEERDPLQLARWQIEAANAKIREADIRAEISRRKQITVIKWAK